MAISQMQVKEFILSLLPEQFLVKRRYKKEFGLSPNLKSPELFTEKIQWLKLNDKTPLKTKCTDKVTVREFVSSKIGERFLIPQVFVTENVEDITANALPDYPVIIKPNHDSGGGWVIPDKYDVDYSELRENIQKRLARNYFYFSGEWEYKDIRPSVIVEKFLGDDAGGLLNDYKIHCFNGKPKYIQTIFNRGKGVSETWYDLDWVMQEFFYFSSKKTNAPRPEKLQQMIEVAEKLASDFLYVRVDLYVFQDAIYFGELTFHPYSGVMKWQPSSTDLHLGKLLTLPTNKVK